jgi:DNA-binding beta-propeller fold protein YncE
MHTSSKIGAAVCCLLFWIVSCTDKNLAGNVTQTGNPTIAGIIYRPDGKTAASKALVYLRNKNSLLDSFDIELLKYFADTAITTSDANGRFSIGSVAPGAYVIECTDGINNFAVIDSVAITRTDSTKNLPAVTLKPAGAIKGVVKLSGGGDPRKVLVLVYSVDKYAKVNADGSFRLGALAEGVYDIRLLPSLDYYDVLDTIRIPVKSADTSDLGTIELRYTGIPVPHGLTAQLDTLKQVAVLSWRAMDTAFVKGFYIYRRNLDSNTVFERINRTFLSDTVYRDAKILAGETYEYRIAAVNKNITEGEKSPAVSVRIASLFLVDTLFGKCGSQPGKMTLPSRIAVSGNGLVYVIEGNSQSRVQVFDAALTFIRQFGDTTLSRPLDVALGADGRVSVADGGLQRVLMFNEKGGLINDSLAIGKGGPAPAGIAIPDVHNIAADGLGRIIATSGVDSIYMFDPSGALVRKWGGTGAGQGQFDQPSFVAVDDQDNLFICDDGNMRIQVFDSTGTFKQSIRLTEIPGGMTVEPRTGRIFMVSEMGNFLDVFKANGELIAHYNFPNYGLYNLPRGIAISGKSVYVALSGICKIIKLINNLPF